VVLRALLRGWGIWRQEGTVRSVSIYQQSVGGVLMLCPLVHPLLWCLLARSGCIMQLVGHHTQKNVDSRTTSKFCVVMMDIYSKLCWVYGGGCMLIP